MNFLSRSESVLVAPCPYNPILCFFKCLFASCLLTALESPDSCIWLNLTAGKSPKSSQHFHSYKKRKKSCVQVRLIGHTKRKVNDKGQHLMASEKPCQGSAWRHWPSWPNFHWNCCSPKHFAGRARSRNSHHFSQQFAGLRQIITSHATSLP